MNNLKRLMTRPDGTMIAFSTHIFFYISLVFGLAFILPPGLLDMTNSPLYMFTVDLGWFYYWGWGLIAVTVANTIMLWTRSNRLASVVGVLGFCLWLFAAFAYGFMGYWFGLLAAALPNLVFWFYYAIMVAQFRQSVGR